MSTEERIKEAIITTLVIKNPSSIKYAVSKIMSIIEEEKKIAWWNGVKDMYRRTVKKTKRNRTNQR